jgi:two-component system, NtrC family, response regulator HydG
MLAMDLPISDARDLVIEEFERRYLERVLARNKGVVTEAAKASGVARRHFQRLRARTAKYWQDATVGKVATRQQT